MPEVFDLGRGQVWYTQFPFEDDLTKSKDRTCLIIGWSSFGLNDDQMIWVMPIFSFDGDSSKAKSNDILLDAFGIEFLKKGSYLRASRVAAVGPNNILKRDGYLGTVPVEVVNHAIDAMVKVIERKSPIES